MGQPEDGAVVSRITACVRIIMEGFESRWLPFSFRKGGQARCNVYHPDGAAIARQTTALGHVSQEPLSASIVSTMQEATCGTRTVYLLGPKEAAHLDRMRVHHTIHSHLDLDKDTLASLSETAIHLGQPLTQGVYLYRGAFVYVAEDTAPLSRADMRALSRMKPGKLHYAFSDGGALPAVLDQDDGEDVEVVIEEEEDDIVVEETSY